MSTEDAVARIRSGWARIRPDLPTQSVGVFTLLARLAHDLRRDRAQVLRGLGVDQATLELLANLRRDPVPEGWTPRELGMMCGVSAGAISQRLQRAETAGWVSRGQDPHDLRVVRVHLTAEGFAVTDQLAGRVLARDAQLLDGFSSEALDTLESLLGDLSRHITARLDRDPQRASSERS